MELSDSEAACRAQWPTLTPQTAVARADCINDAEESSLIPASEGFADLIEQRIAYRRALAVQIAHGDMSPQQAQYKFSQLNADLANQARAREAQSKQPNPAAVMAFANGDDATVSELQTTQPAYTPP